MVQVRKPTLQSLHSVVVNDLLPQFESWDADHLNRGENSFADRLANEAVDNGTCGLWPDRWPSAEV